MTLRWHWGPAASASPPIPNKISVVGIEVPNRAVTPVRIRDVVESRTFTEHKSPVAFAVGKDIGGSCIVGGYRQAPPCAHRRYHRLR